MFGSVPPAYGRARDEFLMDRGTKEARRAAGLFSQATEELEPLLRGDALPFLDHSLRDGHPGSARYEAKWRPLAVRLAASHEGPLPGEAAAREALMSGIDAYRDLELTDRAIGAHRRMHRYAELVGGLYGCWMEWNPGERVWMDVCALVHAHSPMGMSVGFVAKRLCSVCRDDITVCDHDSLSVYEVAAARYEDTDSQDVCSICHEAACSHVLGVSYQVRQRALLGTAEIEEVSATQNPREPRCRFTSVEMSPQPPPPRSETQRLRCHRCIGSCGVAML